MDNPKIQQRILIVDDDPINREIMSETLCEDYLLSFAASGEEALEKAQQLSPDLMLLDIMMPGLDGYETCRRLRTMPKLKHTKVVLVSAKAMLAERIRGYEAGADDYITKPFDPAELHAKVKVFLRLKSIEEIDELKSNILNLLRHETRTPMTGMLACTELLLEESGLNEAQRLQWLRMLHRNCKRLHDFLEKGTLLCSYKAGNVTLKMEDVNLGVLVDSVLRESEAVSRAGNLRIETDLADDVWGAVHREHFLLVLSALIENAIINSPAGATVSIRLSRADQQGILTITDHGPGIPPEILGYVLEGLVVGDIDHHNRGDGLNLALSRAIIQYHGGEMRIESLPNRGTHVIIMLPVLDAETLLQHAASRNE